MTSKAVFGGSVHGSRLQCAMTGISYSAGTTYFRSALLLNLPTSAECSLRICYQPFVMLLLSLLCRSLLPWRSADSKAALVPQHGAVFGLHSADALHARLVGLGVLHRPRLLDSLCVLPFSLPPAHFPITFTHFTHKCWSTMTAIDLFPSLCTWRAIAQ